MLKSLRITAILEGISYLLFALTMPLKYVYDILLPNKIVGSAHGFLFVLYCVLVIIVAVKYKFSWGKAAVLLIASIIPFGTFWAEKKYLS